MADKLIEKLEKALLNYQHNFMILERCISKDKEYYVVWICEFDGAPDNIAIQNNSMEIQEILDEISLSESNNTLLWLLDPYISVLHEHNKAEIHTYVIPILGFTKMIVDKKLKEVF